MTHTRTGKPEISTGRPTNPRGSSPARSPRRPGLPKPATTPKRRAWSRQEISMEYDPNPPTPEEVAEAFRFKYQET